MNCTSKALAVSGTLCMTLVIIAAAPGPAVATAAPPEVQAVIDALYEARRVAEFVCTFEYRAGSAASWDDAVAERFDGVRNRGSATGRLVKRGDEVRRVWTPTADAKGQAGPSFDELATATLQLRVMGDRDRELMLERRKPELAAVGIAGALSRTQISPFAPFGGSRESTIDISTSPPEEKAWVVKDLGQSRLSLQVEGRFQEELVRQEAVIDMSNSTPRLVELRREIRRAASWDAPSTQTVRHAAFLSDFRTCGGAELPAKIVNVSTRTGGPIDLEVWKSRDLGARKPVDADFDVPVNPGTMIAGVSNYVPPRGDWVFHLRTFPAANIGTDVVVVEPLVDVALSDGRSWRWYLLWLNLLVIVVVAGALLRKRFILRSDAA
jgi:hypothetical protein